jgi:hypothetical protein
MELDTSKRDVAKSSPWGKVAQPSAASASLSEIMSEQLAVDLHDKYVFVSTPLNSVQAKRMGLGNKLNYEISLPFREVKTCTQSSVLDPMENAMANFDSNPEGYDSDEMIARMLQMQFDKEHDEVVKRTEAKYNGTSKGRYKNDKY